MPAELTPSEKRELDFAAARREAEHQIVIGLLGNPTLGVELSTQLDAEDFRDQFAGVVFGLICELQLAERYSEDRLRGELRKRSMLDSTHQRQLLAWEDLLVSDTTTMWQADQLRQLRMREQTVRRLSRAIDSMASIDRDPIAVLDDLVGHLEGLKARQGSLWSTAGEVHERCYLEYRAALDGDTSRQASISTGYPSLDDITSGFFRGQLWLVAARSYMGKSTVALALATQQIERGRGVYFASYEMESGELMERIYAERTGIPLGKFTRNEITRQDLDQLLMVGTEFGDAHYCFDDRPPASVAGLKARVKLASVERPIDLLVIDHLLMFPSDPRIQRHEQLVEITRALKELAKECNLTVLLLNQLNADAEGVEPTNKHFSQAKGILQNLDVCVLLHRETNTSEDMLFKVTKNRKGAPADCRLKFLGEIQRVCEYSSEDMPNFEDAFVEVY